MLRALVVCQFLVAAGWLEVSEVAPYAVLRTSREAAAGANATPYAVLRHTSAVTAAAYAPDGASLATGGADETIRLWDPVDGTALRVVETKVPVLALAFSPDGAHIASGGVGGKRYVRSAEFVRHVSSESFLTTHNLRIGSLLSALMSRSDSMR